jgi:hypothetical protein
MPILLVLLLFVFTSCATPSHARDSQPTRVEIIQEDYQSLAKCVTQKIEVTGVARKARMSFNEQDKVVRVYEPFGFVHNTNTFEFLFVRMTENRTKVESYGYETLVGRDHYPNQIWPYVMECAGLDDSETQATFPGIH